MKRYCKEHNPLDDLWMEYTRMFDSDQEMPLCQSSNMELYNTELTLAMFGSAVHAIQRRRKELEILKQQLEDIECSQRESMRFLPSSEETLEFFWPILVESAELFA